MTKSNQILCVGTSQKTKEPNWRYADDGRPRAHPPRSEGTDFEPKSRRPTTTGRAASHRRHLTRSFFVVILVASAADEIRRVIDATSADVSCLLRIGAKRTGPIDHVPCHVQCDDSVGSDSFLPPVLQRREHVEGVRTGTTNAMVYAGCHKEPEELGNLLILIADVRIDIPTEIVGRFQEVLNRAEGRERRVRPAVPHNQLATVCPESGQVGVRRIQEFACRSQPPGVGVKVKSERVETRSEDEKPQDLVLKGELQCWSHTIPCEP